MYRQGSLNSLQVYKFWTLRVVFGDENMPLSMPCTDT